MDIHLEKPDPEWIKVLADSIHLIDWKINKYEKKIIRDLYLDYLHNGLNSEQALRKAIDVLKHFKNNKK